MKEEIMELRKMFTAFLKGIIKSMTDSFEQKHFAHEQNMYQQQKRIFDSRVESHMTNIKMELFDVLSTNSYSRFSITHPNNIRIVNYKNMCGRLTYLFSIPLNRDNSFTNPISGSGLDNIKNQIIRDIESFRRELKYRFVNPAQYYPLLSAGIYIENIKHIGDELYLEISTTINPTVNPF